MAKIPFDIKYRPQIESGEYKVENRKGEPVRVVCYDAKISALHSGNQKPILSLQKEAFGEDEIVCHHFQDGMVYRGEEDARDLFIITPEPELSKFEQSIVNAIEDELHHASDDGSVSFGVSIDNETAKVLAKKLLALAREQFTKDGYVIEKKAFHDAVNKVDPEVMKEVSVNVDMKEALRLEYKKGRADVLKDLPRWERIKPGIKVYSPNGNREEVVCGTLYDLTTNQCISLSELKKLPGFKEDSHE